MGGVRGEVGKETGLEVVGGEKSAKEREELRSGGKVG